MQKTIHRFGALLLTLCLLLSLCAPAMAAETKSGTFHFDPHEGGIDIGDLPDTYVYSDDYFSKDSSEANIKLATMSMQLAAASISSHSYDRAADAYETRSKNVEDLLGQLGFEDIEVNENYNKKMGEDTMGVAVAYKALDKDTVLLAIVPRSAGYESEWSGNFHVGTAEDAGTDGLHVGFKTGRDIALDFAKEYVSENPSVFSGKTLKVWTVGYSRGAAVANLIGAAVAEGYDFGSDSTEDAEIVAAPTNVYAYTFGTPNTVVPKEGADPRGKTYQGLHSYYSNYDPVKMTPFSTWGFTRYGQDHLLDTGTEATKAKMLSYLSTLNKNVYTIYTEGGGDPDSFTEMKVDLSTLSVTPVPDGLTQEGFFEDRVQYLTEHRVADRDAYVNGGYEDMLRTMMVLMFGGDGGDMGRLVNEIKENKTLALISGASIAAYSLLQGGAEQYSDTATLDIEGLSQMILSMLSAWLKNSQVMDDVEDLDVEALSKAYTAKVAELSALLDGKEPPSAEALDAAYKEAIADFSALLNGDTEQEPTGEEEPDATSSTEAVAPVSEEPSPGTGEGSTDTTDTDTPTSSSYTYANCAQVAYGLAVGTVEALLTQCTSGDVPQQLKDLSERLTGTDTTRNEYVFSAPFVRFISAVAFGTELTEEEKEQGNAQTQTQEPEQGQDQTQGQEQGQDQEQKPAIWTLVEREASTAATLYANYGKFMRVHNNEILVSWLRAMDDTYQPYTSGGSSSRHHSSKPAATVAPVETVEATDYRSCTKGSTCPVAAFADASAAAWYHDGLHYCLDNGLMNGYSATSFGPNDSLTRAQVVTVLWRIAGSPTASGTADFSDVAAGAYYAAAVRWAAEHSIVLGYEDGSFHPNDSITREQFAALLYRYAAAQGSETTGTAALDGYSDAQSVSSWAREAIQWACQAGILNGADGKLMPQGSATRAQSAAIFQRFCEMGK